MDRFSPIYSPGALSWFRIQSGMPRFAGAREGLGEDDNLPQDGRDSLAPTSQEARYQPDAAIMVSRRLRSTMNLVPNLSIPRACFQAGWFQAAQKIHVRAIADQKTFLPVKNPACSTSEAEGRRGFGCSQGSGPGIWRVFRVIWRQSEEVNPTNVN